VNATDERVQLEEACLELARATKWARRPIDVDQIRDLARRLSEIARERAPHGEQLGIDIALITRAVRYLSQAHAIPPMGDDTQWFSNMLDAVLEVARPNSSLTGDARGFLRDLLYGIGTFVSDKEYE
jgi:hypothetical protein